METVITVGLVVLGVVVFLKVTKVVFKVALVVVLALVVLSYLNGDKINIGFDVNEIKENVTQSAQEAISNKVDQVIDSALSSVFGN